MSALFTENSEIDNSEMNDLYPEDSTLEAVNVPPFIYFFVAIWMVSSLGLL